MQVGIDEAGHNCAPAEVHARYPGGGKITDLIVRAHRQESPACYRDRLRSGIRRVQCGNRGVVQDEFRLDRRTAKTRRAEKAQKFAPGWIHVSPSYSNATAVALHVPAARMMVRPKPQCATHLLFCFSVRLRPSPKPYRPRTPPRRAPRSQAWLSSAKTTPSPNPESPGAMAGGSSRPSTPPRMCSATQSPIRS